MTYSKAYQKKLEEALERVCKANEELLVENEKLKAALIEKQEHIKNNMVEKWMPIIEKVNRYKNQYDSMEWYTSYMDASYADNKINLPVNFDK